jgi:hypothetical protein
MSKGYALFCLVMLIGAVAFYRANPLISIVFFMMLVGAAFGAGRLG